ncbi:MAG: hypothetical protein BRC31_06710 [Actinobacteria bacterium QS_5_72_10]|nr:MAG: hypothetical protein BRC31_06710 [Actinobacteria bacterium QS_5_72_10]
MAQLAEPGADVGIESIAERAGVSRATLSYHFHAAGDRGFLERVSDPPGRDGPIHRRCPVPGSRNP